MAQPTTAVTEAASVPGEVSDLNDCTGSEALSDVANDDLIEVPDDGAGVAPKAVPAKRPGSKTGRPQKKTKVAEEHEVEQQAKRDQQQERKERARIQQEADLQRRLDYGKKHEAHARATFLERLIDLPEFDGVNLFEVGGKLWELPSPDGASAYNIFVSPDGVGSTSGLDDKNPEFVLEIKVRPEPVLVLHRLQCPFPGDHEISIDKVPSYYYPQVQLQIAAFNAKLAYFVMWRSEKTNVFRIYPDDACVQHLKRIYRNFEECARTDVITQATTEEWKRFQEYCTTQVSPLKPWFTCASVQHRSQSIQ